MRKFNLVTLIVLLGIMIVGSSLRAETAPCDLKNKEFKDVIVPPAYLFHMEQYHNLMQSVTAARSIKTIRDKGNPFDKIVLGRPALGTVTEESDSWKTVPGRAGFNTEINLQGLGSNNQFADLFVSHIKDAAKASGIGL